MMLCRREGVLNQGTVLCVSDPRHAAPQSQAKTDANIFVFALNLEYMEADFYSWASSVSSILLLGPRLQNKHMT